MGNIVLRAKSLAALLVMAVAIAVTAIPAGEASAARQIISGKPSYCDASLPNLSNMNIGTEVPVILAHGLLGNPSDWGSMTSSTSFAGRISNIPGVEVAQLYEYNTAEWVTEPSGGPKMAKTIDCLSQLSKANQGKGKVIVVGYSMGGLVARDAFSYTAADGSSIASKVGQVVTIGTPHAGADYVAGLAGWFTAGSPELEALPDFPSQVAVHTIAGDVTRVTTDLWGGSVTREQPHNDTLVSTNSAHDQYTIDVNKGGGQKTVTCEKYFVRVFGGFTYDTGKASREHSALLSNPLNGVRPDTINAITKYVTWLNTTPPAPTTVDLTVNGVTQKLTTRYDNRWHQPEYGASGPGYDAIADDTTNGTPCPSTSCPDTTPVPIAYPTVYTYKILYGTCNGPLASCALDSPTGVAPAVTIGGRTPDSSARRDTAMVWCFDTEKICITYSGSYNPQLQPSQALLDVFNTATWANL